jgi:hypothetical protein
VELDPANVYDLAEAIERTLPEIVRIERLDRVNPYARNRQKPSQSRANERANGVPLESSATVSTHDSTVISILEAWWSNPVGVPMPLPHQQQSPVLTAFRWHFVHRRERANATRFDSFGAIFGIAPI